MTGPDLHPPLPPFRTGHLPVTDGHRIYFECSGNRQGIPALILHGGPGSGLSETTRRFFDPAHYHIIQFDQRHCGRSLPFAGDPMVDLSTNTLAHLLEDIEALRLHLGIERWLVMGGSWGSTLALAYAQAHREQVLGLLLTMVVTTSAAEIEWITRGVGQFFPADHARFLDHLPRDQRDGDLTTAYHRLLINPDKEIHEKAASAWCAWESATLSVKPGYVPHVRWSDARFRLCFSRLVTHYWSHRAWLADGEILQRINLLDGLPAILIHGRLDFGSPLKTAYDLHQAWPGSRLIVVEDGEHNINAPGMAASVIESLQRLARELKA
ncbi:prolyl aminopeptidase [Agrobacterium vitis]|uniref:prolyl aminopeptidase n=1 Tax=Agrobacterium vitis TaxID=373 RepID=UPI0008721992|nr:prolyl aminopeptidase [Agrobacterium vitis]MCE6077146.1 prolyl aminopeptidase [Agrobacterium vitis]MCM2452051.1 prolyl aminopeptidase [Agrobacterium vitis]MCM2469131.1 prolyl aminopeptidase [Agrobacterium vitis]MUO69467.1 prolyl aminopeptidase [Agrobacterium vitis]